MLKFNDQVKITGISFFEGVCGRVVDKHNYKGGEYLVVFDDPRVPNKWIPANKVILSHPYARRTAERMQETFEEAREMVEMLADSEKLSRIEV